MNKTLSLSLTLALTAAALPAVAAEPTMPTQCVTRTVDANYSGTSWMAQNVCKENEVAISGNGFCKAAGAMVGASTTKDTLDRQVWLWCAKAGAAVWYGTCCQQTPVPANMPPKSLKQCVTRTVNAKFAGNTWVSQQVCKPNEVAASAGGFCSQAGQMVGASTTKDVVDGKVWLWCTQPGDAVWYGMCCQN